MSKFYDGLLAGGSALVTTGIQGVNATADTFAQALGNATNTEVITVALVGLLVPMAKDIVYWLGRRILSRFNKRN